MINHLQQLFTFYNRQIFFLLTAKSDKISICSGFFLSSRRTPRWVVGNCPGFPGMTAASESAVAQWAHAPTNRSPELSKLQHCSIQKRSTHQQGKSLPLDAFRCNFAIENSHFWTPGTLDEYLERVKMALSHALPCIGMWYGALDTFQVGCPTLEEALPLDAILP